jgi:hypothetical protein
MVADQNLSFEFPTSESFQAYAHFMRPDGAKHLPALFLQMKTKIIAQWVL